MRDRALRDARAGFPAVVDEAVRGEGTVATRDRRRFEALGVAVVDAFAVAPAGSPPG